MGKEYKKRSESLNRPLGKRILKGTLTTLFVLFVISLVLIVGGIGVGAGIVSAMVKDEKLRTKDDFQKDFDSLTQNSYAYFQNKDKNGDSVLIGKLRNNGNSIKPVTSTKDVSKYLIDAFISTEDQEFYEHSGIVPRSLMRATIQQATKSDTKTGGSTITQQLVKNVILKNSDKDVSRKAKEIVLAIRLDSMFEKEEIFVHYLNSVYFGKGADGLHMYGVQSAAHGLFNKEVDQLEPAQAAYIAGMVQRPNDYNPISEDPKNLQRGLSRMKIVLNNMLANQKITQQQYDEALKFDIKASLAKPSDFENSYTKYPFIMHAIEEEAAEVFMEMDNLNITELSKQGKYRATLKDYKKKAMSGGYRFYTTIDQQMYDAVNKAATERLKFRDKTYKGIKDHEQLGAVIIDNRNGAVLAFVSGANQGQNINQKDHALHATNQPGSAIKPLLVYAPAVNEGVISSGTLILDEMIKKSDGSGYYKNANNKYKGPVNASTALKYSYNIPAIKVFNHMGHQTGFEYLNKMGIPPHENDGESAAIGGATNGYTVEKMTAAFATLGNDGKYNKPFMISKIEDADGKVIWEHQTQPVEVFTPQTAFETNKMLRQVLTGTGAYVGGKVSGYDLAGKTGTTSDDKDLWFVGYTPQITLGVWGGYDYNFSMKHNSHFTKQAWVNIFKAAAQANPGYFDKKARFNSPGGGVKGIACIECDRIRDYHQKKQAEEDKKKQDDHRKGGTKPPGHRDPDPPITTPPTFPPPNTTPPIIPEPPNREEGSE
ncbi:transglycosylase domain-containing protein [Hazenella coriacea]|uniref:Penicillin-binding protein n=1 Tax=Hazenella coriacea TaxID=1179467 RepID=A0A4R3L7U8_9BACL|nr:transglycosylase domain-containing protein [Hazenella coriacea]TCS95060.1 penicillin-binding protein [Hazenella coriacea]